MHFFRGDNNSVSLDLYVTVYIYIYISIYDKAKRSTWSHGENAETAQW